MGNIEKNTPFVISISGDPVSGKSSTIKALMEQFKQDGYKTEDNNINQEDKVIVKVSSGVLFRKIAEEAGIEVSELTSLAKNSAITIADLEKKAKNKAFFLSISKEDKSKNIDNFIDTYIASVIEEKKEKYRNNPETIIIADSRIAGLFMKRDNKQTFNIRFAISPEEAAKRQQMDKDNRQGERQGSKAIQKRRKDERDRFLNIYGFDLYDMDNYDLVINTSGISKSVVSNFIYNVINKVQKGEKVNKFYRSSKHIRPGRPEDKNEPEALRVIKVKNIYYAITGQHVVGLANGIGYKNERDNEGNVDLKENKYSLLPYTILATDDEVMKDNEGNEIFNGITAEEYVARFVKHESIKKFEKKYRFKYEGRGRGKVK